MAKIIRSSETEICHAFEVSYTSVGEKIILFTVCLFISQLWNLSPATVVLPEDHTQGGLFWVVLGGVW